MRALSYLACCCLFAVSPAEAFDAQAQIRAIGEVIEARYYDAQRGREIADEIVQEAKQGAYDGIDDPNELASRLTSQLRAIDGHFKVVWGDAPPAPHRSRAMGVGRGGVPRGDAPDELQHGFGRVGNLSGNIGYIELLQAAHIDFADPASPVRAKVDEVLARLRNSKALILDLRENGGGSPAMVGYLVSAFVSPREDVYNRFHTRSAVFNERPDVLYPNPLLKTPLFVLVGPGTASAAESIAYTLQACGRAMIVGERTAGAANPRAMFETGSGYSVFVPTGSPRNPLTKGNWEGDGVQPDVSVPAAEALARAIELATRD